MVAKVETYWCDETPTLADIQFIFAGVAPNKYASLKWHIKNKGAKKRIITYRNIKDMSAEEYYKRYILCQEEI